MAEFMTKIKEKFTRTQMVAIGAVAAVIVAAGVAFPLAGGLIGPASEQVSDNATPMALGGNTKPATVTFVQNSLGASGGQQADNALTMIGPYQFNVTGNSNVKCRIDVNPAKAKHSDTAAETAVGYTLAALPGGTNYIGYDERTNSSSAVLSAPSNPKATIYKAYLSVCVTQYSNVAIDQAKNPLANYGVSLKGPKGDINRYWPTKCYRDAGTRAAFFVDVTDFIKEQGYGTYTGINVPYTLQNDNATTSDVQGSWKLILIEENPDLDTRMLRLQLGGTKVEKGANTTVQVSGQGLHVAGDATNKPTGQLVVAMDGADPDNSTQQLGYKTSANTSMTYLYNAQRPVNQFYSFVVDKNGTLIQTTPAPTMTSSPFSGTSTKWSQHGTDLCLMDINGAAGSMQLNGGETSVTMEAFTNQNPTLLTVLGLAIDIVVPEFETELIVSNLNQGYATEDAGYNPDDQYAFNNDRLRVTAISRNVSKEANLGLYDTFIKVEAPALKDIDAESVVARYVTATGQSVSLGVKSIDQANSTVIVEAPEGVEIIKGGYFEVAFEGTAKWSADHQEYQNRVSVEGTFVEKGIKYEDFRMTNLGLAYATTAAGPPRYSVEVVTTGQGNAGVGEVPAASDDDDDDEGGSGNSNSGSDSGSGSGNSGSGSGSDTTPAPGGSGDEDDETPSTTPRTPAAPAAPQVPTTKIMKFDEGGTANVVFVPAEGWYVKSVTVDGSIRDDLVAGTGFTLPVGTSNHIVHVTYAQGQAPAAVTNYLVTTKGDRGVTDLTPTSNVAKGNNLTVSWQIANGYKIVEVLVDGVAYPAATAGNVELRSIASDHTVEVRTAQNRADDKYIVETTVKGPGTVTATKTVAAGSDHTVTWSGANADAVLAQVKVDGVIVFDKNKDEPTVPQPRITSKVFEDIDANHTVEVIYLDPDRDEDDPADILVKTEMLGGEGTITPSSTVAPGGSKTVTWEVEDGYEIDRVVVVRGSGSEVVQATGGTFTLNNIDADCTLQVVVRKTAAPDAPKEFSVTTTLMGGGGTITPSASGIAEGTDHTVTWTVADDHYVSSVTVDGKIRDDLLDKTEVVFEDIAANHTVNVVIKDGSKPAKQTLHKITVSAQGAGTAGPSATVDEGSTHRVTWTPDVAGTRPLRIEVDGQERPDLLTTDGLDFTAIAGAHSVHVVFPESEAGERAHRITTEIDGGLGTVSGGVRVAAGDDHTVTWEPAAGYRIAKVIIDGEERDDLKDATSFKFEKVAGDHTVLIVLEKVPEAPAPADPTDPNDPGDPSDPSDPSDPKDPGDPGAPGDNNRVTPGAPDDNPGDGSGDGPDDEGLQRGGGTPSNGDDDGNGTPGDGTGDGSDTGNGAQGANDGQGSGVGGTNAQSGYKGFLDRTLAATGDPALEAAAAAAVCATLALVGAVLIRRRRNAR